MNRSRVDMPLRLIWQERHDHRALEKLAQSYAVTFTSTGRAMVDVAVEPATDHTLAHVATALHRMGIDTHPRRAHDVAVCARVPIYSLDPISVCPFVGWVSSPMVRPSRP